MKSAHLCLWLLVLSTVTELVSAFDPFSTAWSSIISNFFYKGCEDKLVAFNSSGLEDSLQTKLFGQHIASKIILKTVSGFMNNDNPKKPLVLSLHGSSGTGKNLVSSLIAENLYKEGMNSDFVHIFMSDIHFPHVSQVDTYKTQLQQWIKGNVSSCAQSMFIFDEMDKMHPGLIDSIRPYLEHYDKLDGISYRKAIFIFLSNAEGSSLTETALKFRNAGRKREEMELKDVEKLLLLSAFNNDNSGLWHTSLIEKNLVDFFVPFLPLEYSHVIECTMAAMKAQGLQLDIYIADKLATDMVYFPESEPVFSKQGCKTIGSRLHFYMEDV
ncbi:torsin-1A-like [Nerophis lumbriciformis]|uniref:torsin-1A-like n=1 Tax=Nerophis lumbriciformis TaxID=546530 RepID=UPI002ADF81D7|nr:torsin-1A-like [Nerophis lumbriciformis]